MNFQIDYAPIRMLRRMVYVHHFEVYHLKWVDVRDWAKALGPNTYIWNIGLFDHEIWIRHAEDAVAFKLRFDT